MRKQELRVLRGFASHVDTVITAMPCLPSDRYKPKVVNAWRLAKKELARVKKILEEYNDEKDN